MWYLYIEKKKLNDYVESKKKIPQNKNRNIKYGIK